MLYDRNVVAVTNIPSRKWRESAHSGHFEYSEIFILTEEYDVRLHALVVRINQIGNLRYLVCPQVLIALSFCHLLGDA
jgi:hypothetical protein